jgi:hypothetical protein
MPEPSSMNWKQSRCSQSVLMLPSLKKKLCEFPMWERGKGREEVKGILKTERGNGKGERGKEREGMGKGGPKPVPHSTKLYNQNTI